VWAEFLKDPPGDWQINYRQPDAVAKFMAGVLEKRQAARRPKRLGIHWLLELLGIERRPA
jgi:hypothetical protein